MSGWAFAETRYTDQSTNLNADLSSGDLSSGAQKNIVAGGSVNIDGLSEDLATQIFGVVQNAYDSATNFVQSAIGTADNRTQQTVETVTQSLKEAYNSEQATISSYKTYAFYAVVAFIAWAYFRK